VLAWAPALVPITVGEVGRADEGKVDYTFETLTRHLQGSTYRRGLRRGQHRRNRWWPWRRLEGRLRRRLRRRLL